MLRRTWCSRKDKMHHILICNVKICILFLPCVPSLQTPLASGTSVFKTHYLIGARPSMQHQICTKGIREGRLCLAKTGHSSNTVFKYYTCVTAVINSDIYMIASIRNFILEFDLLTNTDYIAKYTNKKHGKVICSCRTR